MDLIWTILRRISSVNQSETVKEIKFTYYLLQDIGIEIGLPIIVKADNIGATLMAQNASSGKKVVTLTPGINH